MYKIYTRNVCTPPGYIKKILLIMKITAIFLFAALMQVSATGLAQRLTLVKKDATLKQVFDAVNKQTNYNFVWSADQLNINQPVNADFKDTPLLEVLDKCLSNTGMTYMIEDKTVVIKKKEESLIDKAKAFFAQITLTGKVVDELGQPMVGVTVKQKGTTNATATDSKGAYKLTVPDDNTIIVFSFIGFETKEIPAKELTNGSVITLKATATNLHEVVVDKGYYREKQEFLTGNVTTVDAKVIAEQPVSDPIMALEGRVPGLQITQSSGIPGSNFTILLRGQNSIANGVSPLYIVDGVPFPSFSLTSFNLSGGAVGFPTNPAAPTPIQGGGLSPFNNLVPADIESIEVLKDADATAIYGSRGANGVILITTKKGKAGATRVDVDLNSGIGQVDRTIPLLNTQQYLIMRHEAFKNDGLLPGATDYDVNGTWDTTRYTNWQKVLTGGTAHFTNAGVNISGGNENTRFVFGGAYSDQTTVFPGDYSDQKTSAHFSLDHTSTNKRFHTVITAQYVQDKSVLPVVDFTNSIILAPDAPQIYDAQGNFNFANNTWANPLSQTLENETATSNTLVSSLNASYDLAPGFKIQSNFGYTKMQMNQTQQRPATIFYGPPVSTLRANSIATTNANSWIVEPHLSYTKAISKGRLDILVGSRIQDSQYNTTALFGSGFSSDALITNIVNAATISILGGNSTDYRTASLYGRVNLNWEEKYVINATGSRDGSSRFGPGNQYGNFGAVGAAWLFAKEKFIGDALPFLSSGKLRLSYGITGNDQIADYQYLSAYSTLNSGSYQGASTLIPNRIASPYYAWEVVKKLEGGLELGILKDRVNLSVSVYQDRTGNQLVGQPLPSQDGFGSIQANLPAVVQNAGIEVLLNTINIKIKNFSWSSDFNISSYRNKLVSFPGLAYNSSYSTRYAIGQPLFITPTYHYTGVNPQTGLYTFQDLDNNGTLGTPDKQLLKSIAQDYYGGLSNTFTYKGFELDVFFQFVKQTGNSYLKSFGTPGVVNNNEPILVLSRWQTPGDQTAIQKLTTGGTTGTAFSNFRSSDANIVDASFIRLKNVALSYSLPIKWQAAMHLQNTRIYLQGQNLLTITGYQGLDPETQSLALPPLRMISLGIHASL